MSFARRQRGVPFTMVAILILLLAPVSAVHADVTDGGGSPDFLLKSYVSGQSGPAEQDIYDSSTGLYSFFPGAIGGVLTQTPAVTTYSGEFWVVGPGGDQQLYYNYYNPTTTSWSGWAGIPASLPSGSYPFTSAASIVVYGSYLEVFVRGSNNGLWQALYSGGTWYGWYSFTAANTAGSAPAITTFTGSGERNEFHVAWLGYGSNTIYDEVYNRYGGSAGWNPAVALPGAYTSAPSIAPYGSTLQMWADGLNYQVYQSIFNYGGAQSWQLFPPYSSDVAGSTPAIAEYDVGSDAQFQVFYTMGDVSGTWETKQMVYDPNNGGWRAPVDWSDEQSAPAAAQFGAQLQVWSRDTKQCTQEELQNGKPYHVVDVACQNNNSNTYLGSYAQWDDNNLDVNLSIAPTLAFVLNDMWLYTNSARSDWIETYLEYGPANESGSPCSGCYIQHRGWGTSTTAGSFTHWMGYAGTNGAYHSYEILDIGSGQWAVFLDGNTVQTNVYVGSDTGYEDDVGLEINASPPGTGYPAAIAWAYAATIHNSNLQVATAPGGTWTDWWYQNHLRVAPCSQKSNTVPKCTNGTNVLNGSVTKNYWAVNKPW